MTSRLITDYPALIQAFRDRRDELDLSHELIGEIGGLQSGYAGKLLAPKPIKNLGPMSFGAMLGALGVALVMVEDLEAAARVKERWTKRKRPAPSRCVARDYTGTQCSATKLEKRDEAPGRADRSA